MSLATTDRTVEQRLRAFGLLPAEYEQILGRLGREPNLVELGMLGAMWSEHCGYKHSRKLLQQLPTTGPRVLQGPGENAGAVDIGDGLAVVLKMESHNHPSAVEPFQGAATGVGGILRDIFTMGARPIAMLDSLRFGDPTDARTRYLVGGVIGGIGHYGNCIGVPTVGGEISFDAGYTGNPIVNAMCVGRRADRSADAGARVGPGQPAAAGRRRYGSRRPAGRGVCLQRRSRGDRTAASSRWAIRSSKSCCSRRAWRCSRRGDVLAMQDLGRGGADVVGDRDGGARRAGRRDRRGACAAPRDGAVAVRGDAVGVAGAHAAAGARGQRGGRPARTSRGGTCTPR